MERGESLATRMATGIAIAGGAAMMLVAISIVIGVATRALFNVPLLSVSDTTGLNLAVAIACFFPLGLAGGHLVAIRFLGQALGTRAGARLEVFAALCTLFIFTLIAWQFFRLTLDFTANKLGTTVLQFPQYPWWWVVSLIIIVCIPVQLVVVATTARKMRRVGAQ